MSSSDSPLMQSHQNPSEWPDIPTKYFVLYFGIFVSEVAGSPITMREGSKSTPVCGTPQSSRQSPQYERAIRAKAVVESKEMRSIWVRYLNRIFERAKTPIWTFRSYETCELVNLIEHHEGPGMVLCRSGHP